MLGLLPIMRSTGTGADLKKRIAAPMVGGLVTSFLMELLVYPAIYFLWKMRETRRRLAAGGRGRRRDRPPASALGSTRSQSFEESPVVPAGPDDGVRRLRRIA